MRIVPNLNEVYFCPNCDSPELYVVKDVMGMTEYKYCPRCHEEIREGNIIRDNSALSTPQEEAKTHTIKIPTREEIYEQDCISQKQKEEEKEKFLFNLREEIDRLRYNIHDTHSMMLVNKLTDIFTQIADYIENH
jgi:hypothetical protein